MWIVLLKFCVFNVLWIFTFVVFCVTTFLMVMYNTRTEELKKCVLLKDIRVSKVHLPENGESVDDKLGAFGEKVTVKESLPERSQCEVESTGKVSGSSNSTMISRQSRYKSLMVELKEDVNKTEKEVKSLQDQVSSLSVRREALRNEVLKQQEDYQRMLNNFTKELENKKMMFSSRVENSRQHPRISRFGLP